MVHADEAADNRAPKSIEADIEATRERLAGTIDLLLYRSSPKTIARREIASVRAYFVDGNGAPRTDNIVKVSGAVVGFVAVMLVLRRIVK